MFRKRMSNAEKELPQMVNLAEKYFQLAELEDSESWETEVLLKADQTIHVGETDGPLFKTASGTWLQDEHGRFEMSLSRRYDAGHEKRKTTDVGEFDFEVGRVYSGELSYVGASIAVSGSIHIIDEKLGNEEVGFFNLIDTTSSRRNMDS
jgi:hypothetical protein